MQQALKDGTLFEANQLLMLKTLFQRGFQMLRGWCSEFQHFEMAEI